MLVYDHVRASARSEKFAPLWVGPVRLEEKISEHIWQYKELKTSASPGRKKIQRVHEDHIQSFTDKR